MNPTAKKALKIFSYFWLFTGILLVLLVVVINLPFGHAILTRQTNSFLKSKGIPISVDRISLLLNGEIGLQNVRLITGVHDTIVFASTINVSFEIIPLIRKKVVVNNVQVNDVVVFLESDSVGNLNLLSFFPTSENPQQSESQSGNSWEVQLDESHLQNIRFSYIDKRNGIFINQFISDADLTFDHFSLLEKKIDVRNITINKSIGLASVSSSVEETTNEDTIPSPWKFSAHKIDMVDLHYTYENPTSHQKAEVEAKQIILSLKKLDLSTQELIVAELELNEPLVTYKMPEVDTSGVALKEVANENNNNWAIFCNSLNVTKGNFNILENKDSLTSGLQQWLPVRNFNTTIHDFALSPKGTGLNLDQLSFSLNNKLFLQSAKAKVEADAKLNGKLSLDLVLSTVLDNTSKFTRGDTVSISAALDGSMEYLKISTLNIITNSGMELDISGSVSDLTKIADSRFDLLFHTNTISEIQTQRVISLFDNTLKLPSFKPYSLKGNISNTFLFPQFDISVKSGSGIINLEGKYNTENRYTELDAAISHLMTGEIFGDAYPESVSANVIWSGKVGGLEELSGKGALKISELKYKDFTSRDFNLDFFVENSLCQFTAVAADTNLTCDINGEFGWNNSSYQGRLNGKFYINEARSNLLPQQIAIESNIDASFLYSVSQTSAFLNLDTIILHQNNEIVSIDSVSWEMNADFDNLQSVFKSDFLNAELHSRSSLNEFIDAIRKVDLKKTFSTDSVDFMNASNISAIPVLDFSAKADYDSLFGLFLPDTVFKFNSANISLRKTPEEEKIKLEFSSDSISYLSAHAFGTKLIVTSEEKQLSGNLTIDSTKVNEIIGGRSEVKVDILPDKISGSLLIADSSGAAVYQLGADAIKGKEQIVFRTDNPDWIINSNKWNLTNPLFLIWEIESNDFVASLSLDYDQMEIEVAGRMSDTMNLSLHKVQISRLLAPRIMPLFPDGVLDANVNYSVNETQHLNFDVDVAEMKWRDIFVEHMRADGYFNIDTTGMVESEIMAHLNDSSAFVIKLQPNENRSDQNVSADFKYVPIQLIEPFAREYINNLGGYASGTIEYSEENTVPVIDGKIKFESVTLNIIPLRAWFFIPEDSIVISRNQIYFDRFKVLDSLEKQLYVNGTLNLQDPDNITSDLQVSLDDIRVMNTTSKDNPDFFGSIIVNSGLKITGPVIKPSITGSITLQEGTDITYRQENDISVQETQSVITFASLTGDTTDQIFPIERMREISGLPVIETTVEITPKSIFNFEIVSGYDIHIKISGSGLLNYAMLPNNSMSLTGKYEISQGTADLKFTGWPLKYFTITKGSSLRWDGDVSDPEIDLEATSKVKGSYVNPVDGKNRYVDFIVSMKLTQELSKLNIVFSVQSSDQYITSVLSALPEDEQMRQAVNLLIFESINLPNIESSSNYLTSQMNSFWESQLNAITKTSFKKIDLSFGVDSYTQKSSGGAEEEKTSLTYEMEKKFFHDRASVKISGRFNDDPQAGQQANSMVENFIFEYELDSLDRKFLKLYARKDYEDILDGEVTKSGIGFIYRKSYPDFRSIWRKRNKEIKVTENQTTK